MSKKTLNSDIVGLEFDPVPVKWRDNDTMLYALSVGCTDADLDFVYEARGPKVVPTYGVIPGMTVLGGLNANVDINLMMVLHGEQSIEMYRPIPPRPKNAAYRGAWIGQA